MPGLGTEREHGAGRHLGLGRFQVTLIFQKESNVSSAGGPHPDTIKAIEGCADVLKVDLNKAKDRDRAG